MTQPLLDNVVFLRPGVPTELHFSNHTVGPVVMEDPITALVRPVETLTFVVDRQNGNPVNKVYYVTSERHAADFRPFLDDRSYRLYTWTITRWGEGLLTRWTVVRDVAA